MKCKTKTIYLFMTESDSVYFLNYLLGRDSVCINATPSLSKYIEVVDRIPVSTKNSNKLYAIINTSIVSLNKYIKNSELISGYYHYPQIGEGIIQFLPCYLSNYNEKCIMYGQLSFSYSDKDSEEWIKNIFTWIKKNGKKVYRTSITRDISSDKPEKNTYSLPDASKTYNGSNGRYLTIGNNIYCRVNE